MDILTPLLIVVLIEAGLYGICCLMCREKHVPDENRTQPKITHHHPPHHPPHVTHEIEHQEAWAHANDHHSNRQENNARLVCFPPRISSLRDCE
jgi:hypothetical protein